MISKTIISITHKNTYDAAIGELSKSKIKKENVELKQENLTNEVMPFLRSPKVDTEKAPQAKELATNAQAINEKCARRNK